MSSYAVEFDRLLTAIQTAKPEAELALLAELIALADRNNDPAAAEDATLRRLRVANGLGDFATEFAAFEQLARWHAGGRSNLRAAVLWYYKWIAEHLPEFPSLSRNAIEAFFDRMEACFRAEKEGLRPVYCSRMAEAAFSGHEAEADAWRAKWEAEPADDSDNCPACETHSRVDMLLHLGRAEEAVAAAEPIFKGEQSCAEVPTITFSRLLLPLLRESKPEFAEAAHRYTIRHVRKVPKFLRHLAEHVTYLTLLRREGEACRLVSVMLARGEQSRNGWDRYRVAASIWMWATARRSAGHPVVLIPRRLPWAPRDGVIAADALIARFKAEAESLGVQFDARNGTDVFAKRLASARAMEAYLSRPPSTGDDSPRQ